LTSIIASSFRCVSAAIWLVRQVVQQWLSGT
jgi:hypothetical protein